MIFVDWEKGATGPAYAVAAANTQLIGRQLAILIMDMVALNSDPDRIHLIGFSLGAHVAGFAGKALKRHNIVVGRITGEKRRWYRRKYYYTQGRYFVSQFETRRRLNLFSSNPVWLPRLQFISAFLEMSYTPLTIRYSLTDRLGRVYSNCVPHYSNTYSKWIDNIVNAPSNVIQIYSFYCV